MEAKVLGISCRDYSTSLFGRLKIMLAGFFLVVLGAIVPLSSAYAEDEFVPAYQNEGGFEFEDYNKYITYRDGRKYYTSGKPNGIRVNENNEESTDETIGILTFVITPATLLYMNFVGWWE